MLFKRGMRGNFYEQFVLPQCNISSGAFCIFYFVEVAENSGLQWKSLAIKQNNSINLRARLGNICLSRNAFLVTIMTNKMH